ncbi:hypothetical protein [Actinomadura terrae]|uniref:hypothetical protein n=1 Tax=Actinomadura terrae TaxID=604353 RepID=UPI001FA6B380|nr:hypothetical protein [Actinomadura terrae]
MVIWSENPGGVARVVPAPVPPVQAARVEPVPRILERVAHWHGKATGHWFAMVPGRWAELGALLVEADTEEALTDQVWQLVRGIGSFTMPSR